MPQTKKFAADDHLTQILLNQGLVKLAPEKALNRIKTEFRKSAAAYIVTSIQYDHATITVWYEGKALFSELYISPENLAVAIYLIKAIKNDAEFLVDHITDSTGFLPNVQRYLSVVSEFDDDPSDRRKASRILKSINEIEKAISE